jgi:ribosomal protein L36
MSASQIQRASTATLLARLHTLSVSINVTDRTEAKVIRREIQVRLICGEA